MSSVRAPSWQTGKAIAIAGLLWGAAGSYATARAGVPDAAPTEPPAAAPDRDAAMPPTTDDGEHRQRLPTDGAMPPSEYMPRRRKPPRNDDAPMPPRESPRYRSAAPTASNQAMPPQAYRRTAARRRPSVPAWLRHHAPSGASVEMSLVSGALFPSRAHELYDGRAQFLALAPAAATIGGRIDFFALPWFGFEIEGVAMPTRVRRGARVLLAGLRGGVVLRLPWRLAPLLAGGIGALAVSSSPDVLGDDVDESFHIGGGLQFFATRLVMVRLDVRDNITHRRGVGGAPAHHAELLLAVGVRFGASIGDTPRPTPSAVPRDTDGDRVADAFDHCPAHPGTVPHGCPLADRDGDGFPDRVDACPDAVGIAPEGCPPPNDDDGDGLVGADDRCPSMRGSALDDGCPAAELPTRAANEVGPGLAELEGVLVGVAFDSGTLALTPTARATLSRLADALQRSPGVRVEVVGHTDDRGSDDANRTLSTGRATAVVRALVDRGVAADRLVARGAAGDEPIASNATAEGRATNRRVELVILRDE